MKAYVINLPASTTRRAHMDAELRRADLEHEFIVATDPRLLSAEEYDRRVDAATVARAPDWLRPGIVGAALSHLDAYRAIVADGAACALVLEDDAVLPPGTAELLASLAAAVEGREVVQLYYRSVQPCQFSAQDAVDLGDGLRLLYPMDVGPIMAATAYAITRDACIGMLETAQPVRAASDSWGHHYDAGALDAVRCVVPRPFAARTDFKSTIDYLGAPSRPLQRLMTAVAERRIFPLYQLAGWRRALTERRISRFTVVAERSPLSRA